MNKRSMMATVLVAVMIVMCSWGSAYAEPQDVESTAPRAGSVQNDEPVPPPTGVTGTPAPPPATTPRDTNGNIPYRVNDRRAGGDVYQPSLDGRTPVERRRLRRGASQHFSNRDTDRERRDTYRRAGYSPTTTTVVRQVAMSAADRSLLEKSSKDAAAAITAAEAAEQKADGTAASLEHVRKAVRDDEAELHRQSGVAFRNSAQLHNVGVELGKQQDEIDAHSVKLAAHQKELDRQKTAIEETRVKAAWGFFGVLGLGFLAMAALLAYAVVTKKRRGGVAP